MSEVLAWLQSRMVGARDPHPLTPTIVKQEASVLETLLARTGQTLEQVRAQDVEMPGRKKRPEAVPQTPELDRIRDLPRRPPLDGEPLPSDLALAATMSEAFRTPWGTQELRPIQGRALAEIHQWRGMFGPIRVGGGKTLISYLAGAVLDSARPMLAIPAKLKDKTRREFTKLSFHWNGPAPHAIRIESYELLGRPQAAEILTHYKPDLLILDEAHKVANLRAAVTRRVRRYVQENPGTIVVALSGTMTKRSLRDYAHIAAWALPKTCPVPRTYLDLDLWADALDERVNPWLRIRPGALVSFANEEELADMRYGGDPELSAVRRSFRRRVVETPGVVATQDGALGVSLSISALEVKRPSQEVDAAFATLRELWETPDGHPIADGITMWRHARELGLGFYYRWNPRPPDDWLEARKDWAKLCRAILKHNQRGLDSEAQVAAAVDHGQYPVGTAILGKWRAIKDTFEPQTEAVWLSTEVLDLIAEWLKTPAGKGAIVWADQVAFADALAARTGLAYYGRNGRDAKTRKAIEDHTPGEPMIASVASNAEGRNLQAWNNNLIVCAPPNGKIWEQLLGRTHRDGQEAEEVTVHVYMGCIEHFGGLEQAQADARYTQDTQGQAQKLLYADYDMPEGDEVRARYGARWQK